MTEPRIIFVGNGAVLIAEMLQELQRSADCLAVFIGEHPDPGTEALAALHCARAIISKAERQP